MEYYLIITFIIGAILFIIGLATLLYGVLEDSDVIPTGTILFLIGIIAPVTIPLAIIVLAFIGVTYTLSEMKYINAPEWLKKLDIW